MCRWWCQVGVHGPCSVYDPPVSYWCSQHPSGGGAFSFRVPSALTFSDETELKRWADPEGAIQRGMKYARKCALMGGQWVGFDPMTEEVFYLYLKRIFL